MSIVMERSVDALLIAYHREGDREARERALVELMPLVRALASRYAGRGEPLEDLVQVGALGLVKAVDRFDVDRGVEFSSYAVPTIVGEIRRHFRDKAGRCTSRGASRSSVRLARVLDELTNELGRSPTVPSSRRRPAPKRRRSSTRSTRRMPTRRARFTRPSKRGATTAWRRSSERRRRGTGTSRTARSSPPASTRWTSERRIVELRFFEEMTQSQIAAEIGISQMHVSRLLRRALVKMRGRIEEVAASED